MCQFTKNLSLRETFIFTLYNFFFIKYINIVLFNFISLIFAWFFELETINFPVFLHSESFCLIFFFKERKIKLGQCCIFLLSSKKNTHNLHIFQLINIVKNISWTKNSGCIQSKNLQTIYQTHILLISFLYIILLLWSCCQRRRYTFFQNFLDDYFNLTFSSINT